MYVPIKIEAKNFGPFKDLTYNFKKGKSVIVEGENLTDEGQENNGSGKSFLQEILYYCLLGSSSSGKRDVKLIRRGETESKISLELRNDFYDHTLIIKRKIFKSKSSILKVFINGVDQKDKFPSVVEGNKYVLSLLGISSEDLRNYYLINREKFVSFFSSPDSKKRDLIARFSSIDKILGVEGVINEDLKPLLIDKEGVEEDLIKLDSKIEVHRENIEELESIDSIKLCEEQKEEIKNKIVSIKQRIDFLKKDTEEIEKDIQKKDLEKEEEQRIYSIYCKRKERLNKFNYNELISKKEEELEELRRELRKREEQILSKEKERIEVEKETKTYELVLGGKVVCPNCSFNFIPNSEINLNEAKEIVSLSIEAINELREEIKRLEEERKSFNSLKVKVKLHEIELIELKKVKRQKLLREIEFFQNRISKNIISIETSIKNKKETILRNNLELIRQEDYLKFRQEELKGVKVVSNKGQINALKEKIKELENKKELLKDELSLIEDSIQEKKKWILWIKQFYVFLTNKSLSIIEGYCNMFLTKINTDLQIKLEGFKTLADGTIKESINPVIYRGGIEEDYRSFSGGERGRLILSTILSFQRLINQKSKSGGLDLIFIDEVLDQIDSEGIYNLYLALNNLEGTILLTSQVKTKSEVDNRLIIVKENGVSYIKEL